MKILTLDIETTPNLGFVWSLWNQNVGLPQLVESQDVLCFAAKWLGKKPVLFYRGDGMIEAAHALLDEADVVVHYNGIKFDVPHLNRQFLLAGLTPPSPYKQVDLCNVVKKQFRFPSNKLQHVAESLGLGSKVDTDFDLWVGCMQNDAASWRLMEKYNKQDVKLTEQLYLFLLPWISGHPSRRLYDGKTGCPTCSSKNLVRRGYAYTAVSKFVRYRCSDCGSYFRDSRRVSGVAVQSVAS